MVAALDAQRNQRAGKRVHVVAELAVGARVVAGRVAEAVLVGELLDHPVKHLREGQVDERLLRPDVFAGAGVVVLQPAGRLRTNGIARHIVDELRNHHARVAQLGQPALDPFEREEALVVDAAQRAHDVVDGQVAFAHQAVFDAAVRGDGRILDVDVFDVHPQILHGLFGRLAREAVGMMHVPERAHVVGRRAVKQRAQARGVGIYAVGLDQQRHALFLGVGEQRAQRGQHRFVVHVAVGRGIQVAEHAHIGRADAFGRLDVCAHLRHRLDGRPVAQAAARRQAGDGQPQGAQLLLRGGQQPRRKGHILRRVEDVVAQSAHLDAVKAEVLGHRINVRPCVVGAGEGGKGELHCTTHTFFRMDF